MIDNPAVYYRIWGVDNIAYGPVELPTLVSWIRDGRVLPTSWVYREEQDAWSRASDLAELKPLFKLASGAATGPRTLKEGIAPGSLRRIKILSEMDEKQLASLLQYIEVLNFPPHAVVFQKGEHGDAMFLVLQGEVRARNMIDDRENTLSTLGAGECFGEIAVIDEGPRSADVICNQDSILLKLSAPTLKRLFQEAPALAAPFLLALNKAISARVRHLTKRYEDSIHFARASIQQ